MKHFHNSLARRIAAAVVAFAVAAVAFPIAAAAAPAGKVNVNTADSDALTRLPRVGPAIAQRILDYREENGAFEAVEDLMLVRGIGEKTFELIEPYVTLKGDTTLSEKVRASDARQQAEDDGGDEGR